MDTQSHATECCRHSRRYYIAEPHAEYSPHSALFDYVLYQPKKIEVRTVDSSLQKNVNGEVYRYMYIYMYMIILS